jgi:uncharacterized protein (TIGR03546 family)
MFLIRRIGRLLRGKATPLHIYLACILGAMVGFAPGLTQAPALLVALFVLLAVLNANLTAAALTAIPAKLLSLAFMPFTIDVGRLLLDGPTRPIFQTMINAPVLALFGFEYYATTGGLLLGGIFGTLVGFGMVRAVTGFRTRMATLEEGSETFRSYTSTWWANALTWIFVGGSHGKLTYRQLLDRSRDRNPIRPIGIALVLVVTVLAVIAQMYASEPFVTWAVQRSLERANGATVDVQSARLDLRAGRFEAWGVAMADPSALHTDLLRVGLIEGDVGMADLLRRRLRFDRIVLVDASTGAERERPGRLVGPPPTPTPPADDDWQWGDKTLEEILHEAEIWKRRLAQIREWLERLDRIRPDADERRETIGERLQREIRQKGYRHVAAAHLIDRTPWLAVTEIVAEGIEAIQLGGEMLEIRGENLSTQPWLVDDRPRLHIRSETGRFEVDVEMPALARGSEGENAIRFTYRGLSADVVGRQLAFGDVQALQGGTIDLTCDGRWRAGIIDFPLRALVRDSRITIPNVGSTQVTQLLLPIAARGPLDNPRVTLDDDDLADALVDAGRAELAGRVRAEADEALDEARHRVRERVDEEAGRLFERLDPDPRR